MCPINNNQRVPLINQPLPRGRLFTGKTRKDLARYTLTFWGGVINPVLALLGKYSCFFSFFFKSEFNQCSVQLDPIGSRIDILTMIPSVSLPVAPCWLSSGCAAAVRNALSRSSKWINMEPLDLQPANELDPSIQLDDFCCVSWCSGFGQQACHLFRMWTLETELCNTLWQSIILSCYQKPRSFFVFLLQPDKTWIHCWSLWKISCHIDF